MSHQQQHAEGHEDEWEDEVESEEEEESEEESEDDLDDYDEPEMFPLRYSDECPSMPSRRPVGYPHIIQTSSWGEETDKRNLTCADGIATLLWKWKPEHLETFFDLSNPRFELTRVAPNGIIRDMIIGRVDRAVLAGFRVDGPYGEKEWYPQLSFGIERDGKWRALSCSEGGGPQMAGYYGKEFAASIFYNRLWQEGTGVTFTVTN